MVIVITEKKRKVGVKEVGLVIEVETGKAQDKIVKVLIKIDIQGQDQYDRDQVQVAVVAHLVVQEVEVEAFDLQKKLKGWQN